MTSPPPDPVLARRAQIARWTEMGQRVGYGFLGIAVLAFVVGAVSGFPSPVVPIVVGALAAATVTLAPAIVFGYGVRAADREDRERR